MWDLHTPTHSVKSIIVGVDVNWHYIIVVLYPPSQDVSPMDREFRLQLVSLNMWMVVLVALIVYFDCEQE